jgi:hypothetical protein
MAIGTVGEKRAGARGRHPPFAQEKDRSSKAGPVLQSMLSQFLFFDFFT